jgi:hypothetical protein
VAMSAPFDQASIWREFSDFTVNSRTQDVSLKWPVGSYALPYRDTSITRKRIPRKRIGSDPCVFLNLRKTDRPDSPSVFLF